MEDLSVENAVYLTQNESLKADLEFVKADYAVIQNEMDEAKEHFQELDVSATKIAHRCEVNTLHVDLPCPIIIQKYIYLIKYAYFYILKVYVKNFNSGV